MRVGARPAEVDGHRASPGRGVRVRLFGQLDVRILGLPVTSQASPRARSLLAYLLLHREVPQTRQVLAFLLWPDSTEDQARTNLRNLLHTLRRAVPEIEAYLIVTPRTVYWHPEADFWVDVEEFRRAMEEAARARSGSEELVDALRRAVHLYAGDLVEDCYDDWITEERDRMRDGYVSALRQLSLVLAERGEHTEAVRFGRELARMDPLQEDNHRLLMRLQDASGDRAGAVRAYHECAAVLRRELGIEPSAATQEAYTSIVRSGERAGPGDLPAPVFSAAFVGRDREWDEVTRRWLEAEGGRPRLVVVTGEAGVGKTRLIEELSAWCTHRGATVCLARSYRTEGELGYGALTAWLRTPEIFAHLRRSAPADVSELSRILPELGPGVDGAGEGDGGEDGGRRLMIYHAAARTLTTTGKPLLLVADDAQWCDGTSLQFLHYLLRQPRVGPLMVVASARREELDDGHPLAAVLAGLRALDRIDEIALDRLTRADTERLASQLLDRGLDEGDVDDLYAETEGNPLFIVETIRAGRYRPSTGGASTTPRLQAVINARLAHLSESARDVLDVAATVGREFRADLVGDALGVDNLTVAAGLDELWRRGLIREHALDAYDFSHGKIREVAYAALGPAIRRLNHARVAESLERLHQDDPGLVSGQIAVHYDRAGRLDDAVDWYRRAATQAQRRNAYTHTVQLLERANELLAGLPSPSAQARRLEVLCALPTALGALEGFASDRLAEVQDRAWRLARRLGVEPDPPFLRSLVMSSLCRDDFEGARATAQSLMLSAQTTGDHGLFVESHYLLGVTAFWAGRWEEAREHFELVLELFRPEQREQHLLRFGQDPKVVCLSRLANTLAFLGHDDEARGTRDDAIDLAADVGHPYTRDVARVFAALLALDLGEDDRFRGYAALLGTSRDHGGPISINAAAFPGYVEVLDGRVTEGLGRIRAALRDTGPRNPAPGFRATLMRLLLAAHAAAGDPAAAVRAADEALALPGTRIWEPEIRRLRAEFLAADGRSQHEIVAELDRAEQAAGGSGSLGPQRRIRVSRARLSPGP